MKRNVIYLLRGLMVVGVAAIGLGISQTIGKANTNQGNQPISKVVTSGFDKKKVLEVDNQPFFYNGVQVRADKLRDDPKYHFTTDQVGQAYAQAKKRWLYSC